MQQKQVLYIYKCEVGLMFFGYFNIKRRKDKGRESIWFQEEEDKKKERERVSWRRERDGGKEGVGRYTIDVEIVEL